MKYKSWYLEFFVSDEELLSDDFIKKSVNVFETMQSFNEFLNKTLDGFEMLNDHKKNELTELIFSFSNTISYSLLRCLQYLHELMFYNHHLR